jgi:hypothetical protein
MKVIEIVATLDDIDDDLSIFAGRSSPWSPDSLAAVSTVDADPPKA